jgi:PhnB protein
MAALQPYLNFNGNTLEVFNFYKSVFGGEFAVLQRFKDTEHGEKRSPEESEKIMHVALPIGNNTVLMGSDILESMGLKFVAGNNFWLSINPDTEKDAEKYFEALSAGGNVLMPLEKTFWGALFGMLIDKFGMQWMVNYEYPKSK